MLQLKFEDFFFYYFLTKKFFKKKFFTKITLYVKYLQLYQKNEKFYQVAEFFSYILTQVMLEEI